MRTINLIPEDYKGNPRNAGGYSWSKLVMDGYKVDHERSIPGEDLHISVNECLDMLEREHGKIAVRNNGSYGWLKNTAKTRDGNEIDITDAEPIATITGMWCGGIEATVYVVLEKNAETTSTEIQTPSGDTIEETASVVHMADKIDLSELDARNEKYPGWCKKCHSFCYGDCEANDG